MNLNKLLGLALALALGLAPVITSAPQGGIDPNPAQCKKKIVSTSCTSCAEAAFDLECKKGDDYLSCTGGVHKCSNGAECDQKTGSGDCE